MEDSLEMNGAAGLLDSNLLMKCRLGQEWQDLDFSLISSPTVPVQSVVLAGCDLFSPDRGPDCGLLHCPGNIRNIIYYL